MVIKKNQTMPCSNMDGPRDDHTKQSKSEKQILYNIIHMQNLKHLQDTNRCTDIENRLVNAKWVRRQRREGLRVWGQQMQTVTYRVGN